MTISGIEHVVGTVEVEDHPEEMETDIPIPDDDIPEPVSQSGMCTCSLT